MDAFLAGVIAGYGIAIPVGAIAVLILDLALRRGFKDGFAAGAGAASADLLYAGLAALAGELIATTVRTFSDSLQLASAAILLGIGIRGLWQIRRLNAQKRSKAGPSARGPRLYLQFLGLTLLNPLTVAYFGALILGGSADQLASFGGKLLFVAGAGAASFSWQTLLAALGAAGHRRFSPRLQLLASLVGNLIVISFGKCILLANW